jgi:type II secretory pathway component PulF
MPLIVTPHQLAQRGEFYHQLAAMTSAGVGLIQGLEMVQRSPPSRSFRQPIGHLIAAIQQGSTLSDGLYSLGTWMPSFDIALIQAGEQSGRLDVSFRLLSNYYEERARLAKRVIGSLIYPVALLHMAFLIFPTELLTRLVWQGEVVPFVLNKLFIFTPLYAGAFVLLLACQGRHGEQWRTFLEKISRPLPLIGAIRKNLTLARLAVSLEGLICAGVTIIEAWEMAAVASGSPALRRVVNGWKPYLAAGQTPSEKILDSNFFPELFASLYATGERSGKLDETLRRLYNHYQEEGSRKLQQLADWAPKAVFLVIAGLIAVKIISFYTGYFNTINQVIGTE